VTSYFVAGAGGMLGADLMRALAGRDVTGLSRAELDITDSDAASRSIAGFDVVINAAAYTKVDDAEAHETEAFAINATGVANLAAAAPAAGARFVQVSTDYVFDGTAASPYPEDAPRHPVSAYGRTKAEGETLALAANLDTVIVRTAWLYGEHGPNFARTMLRLAGERPTVSVVDDQRGQPTWTRDLAQHIVLLLDAEAPAGIYHGTSSGETSWYGFARAVFELGGHDPDRVQPTTSAEFVRPAPRPAYSVLGHARWAEAGLAPMRPWKDALAEAFDTGALRV
jgi:dTDP-4-dehydrorhamnose reductase